MDLNLASAVHYHHSRFPPGDPDWGAVVGPLTAATAALSRYDEMLRTMVNSEVLLGPLRRRDAVVSSRMEGTISTIDEVLQLEADEDAGDADAQRLARSETVEVLLYSRALAAVQDALRDGAPFSDWLVRRAHQTLLAFGRGANKSPGEYKTEQNYIGARGRAAEIHFVPIEPHLLGEGMERLFGYINNGDHLPIVRTAHAHVEFEALHPFKDGNGRVGRMLVTLMLWRFGLITEPHFFISGYFEDHKDEYIERMRLVSAEDDWTGWLAFFLTALEHQAHENIATAAKIQSLYTDMRERFREEFSSQWSIHALDFVFSNPVFRNNRFTSSSGIPPATANRFTRKLLDLGLLVELQPPAGRRAGLYSFEPLLEIVRT
ncbi:MAG: Fic/DOC family N-terminal domain-containing protein [Paracoccaceae bacterium]|nr:Fic/DOC family N-terminal domain-containing protein [Paracoccaceae bacterium]